MLYLQQKTFAPISQSNCSFKICVDLELSVLKLTNNSSQMRLAGPNFSAFKLTFVWVDRISWIRCFGKKANFGVATDTTNLTNTNMSNTCNSETTFRKWWRFNSKLENWFETVFKKNPSRWTSHQISQLCNCSITKTMQHENLVIWLKDSWSNWIKTDRSTLSKVPLRWKQQQLDGLSRQKPFQGHPPMFHQLHPDKNV